ncbi:MAG: hypothetical protein OSJ74_08270 [Clostridia bacterium]|nr:hypothetical protein [Clostridia bacterium]
MQKYNFFTWWLSFSIKPLPYKIFKSIITSVVFIIWTAFVAVFADIYWKFTVFVFLPVFIVDTVWEIINFTKYQNKYKSYLQETKENDSLETDKIIK